MFGVGMLFVSPGF